MDNEQEPSGPRLLSCDNGNVIVRFGDGRQFELTKAEASQLGLQLLMAGDSEPVDEFAPYKMPSRKDLEGFSRERLSLLHTATIALGATRNLIQQSSDAYDRFRHPQAQAQFGPPGQCARILRDYSRAYGGYASRELEGFLERAKISVPHRAEDLYSLARLFQDEIYRR